MLNTTPNLTKTQPKYLENDSKEIFEANGVKNKQLPWILASNHLGLASFLLLLHQNPTGYQWKPSFLKKTQFQFATCHALSVLWNSQHTCQLLL